MIKYNNDVISVLKKSEEEMYHSNSKAVNIEHFILATLKLNNNVKKLLNSFGITYNKYKKELNTFDNKSQKEIIYSLEFKKVLDLSYDTSNRYSSNEILIEHIFITMLNENINTKLSQYLGNNIEEFYNRLVKSLTNKEANMILEIGTNLTSLAADNKLSKAVGREKEINELINILARKNKNNPILIGEAGVGKTAIVEELANKIVKEEVPSFLKNKKIISINIASVISGTKYRGEFEEKLTKLLKECESDNNIILFIDEIHTIVGAGGAEGAIDASNILKPILARSTLKVIGATTINEYKKYIVPDKALDRRFQKVYIKESNNNETYIILKSIKNEYEKFHNVIIKNELLKYIIELSGKYIFDRNNPDKCIDILDEACAYANVLRNDELNKKINKNLSRIRLMKEESIKKEDFKKALEYKEKEQKTLSTFNKKRKTNVTSDIIIKVIESKCNSKIYDLENPNLYIKIKNKLNKKIICQNTAINAVVDKLVLLNRKKNKMPVSFLFKGSKGVGKEYLVYELAKLLNRNLIKLNMSEFSNELSINKIIGSPQGYVGYNDNNTIFEELKLNPNSIILINEIEKAHYMVLDLIVKILEEGIIKNSKNEIINFKNTIIIITQNIKSNNTIGYIDSNITSGDSLPKHLTDKINYVIDFKKLTKEDIKEIINKQLIRLNKEYNSNITISNDQIDKLVKKSLYDINGASNINNILRNYIENELISSNTL